MNQFLGGYVRFVITSTIYIQYYYIIYVDRRRFISREVYQIICPSIFREIQTFLQETMHMQCNLYILEWLRDKALFRFIHGPI